MWRIGMPTGSSSSVTRPVGCGHGVGDPNGPAGTPLPEARTPWRARTSTFLGSLPRSSRRVRHGASIAGEAAAAPPGPRPGDSHPERSQLAPKNHMIWLPKSPSVSNSNDLRRFFNGQAAPSSSTNTRAVHRDWQRSSNVTSPEVGIIDRSTVAKDR